MSVCKNTLSEFFHTPHLPECCYHYLNYHGDFITSITIVHGLQINKILMETLLITFFKTMSLQNVGDNGSPQFPFLAMT